MSIKYCTDFVPTCRRKALKCISGEGVRECKGFAFSVCDVTARYRVVVKNNVVRTMLLTVRVLTLRITRSVL